jgi:hypothetical protein
MGSRALVADNEQSRRAPHPRGVRATDLRRALALCGCPTLADVGADHVRLAGW